MTSGSTCFACGLTLEGGDRLVLMRGRRQEEHCSPSCLQETVDQRRCARAATKSRRRLRLLLISLAAAGVSLLWQRFRAPQPQSISFESPEMPREAAPPGPIPIGPAWPPTDAEWQAMFDRASWIYPLPGPIRRQPAIDRAIVGLDPSGRRANLCRVPDRCGVDLGGDLWGEHVYAVQDGVVDRVQRAGNDQRGGEYVRLAHFAGAVFTQYFHLAGIPRGLARGTSVRAGDVIGLLGATGTGRPVRQLTFALSVRPSDDFPEVYWDPTPLMSRWSLRTPAHGTVAGFAPEDRREIASHRRP